MTQLNIQQELREREGCDVACVHPDLVSRLDEGLLPRRHAAATAGFFQVLADGTRLRILQALALGDEVCVCDLAWLLGMTISAISHQLRFLRERGVVARRRDGRLVYYRVDDAHVAQVLAVAVDHTVEAERSVARTSEPAA